MRIGIFDCEMFEEVFFMQFVLVTESDLTRKFESSADFFSA